METVTEIKESDMRIKRVGTVKHDNSEVFLAVLGPKAPPEYRDVIFAIHTRALIDDASCEKVGYDWLHSDTRAPASAYYSDRYTVEVSDTDHVAHLGVQDDPWNFYSDESRALRQATAYLQMANDLTTDEWLDRFHARDSHALWDNNMRAGEDQIVLTHRADLKTVIDVDPVDDYGADYARVYPQKKASGKCVSVHERGVTLDTPDHGEAYVRTGFLLREEEKRLLQQAAGTDVTVTMAISRDGKSVLIDAGRMGKTVTKHQDEAVPRDFLPHERARPGEQTTGKLVHVHDKNDLNLPGMCLVEMAQAGRHFLQILSIGDEQGLRAVTAARDMVGHTVTISQGARGYVSAIRDRTPQRKKGLQR